MSTYFVTIGLIAIFGYMAQRSQILLKSGLLAESSEKKLQNRVLGFEFACYLILSLVSGLRYHVGTDYGGYVTSFVTRSEMLWEHIKYFREPGLGFIAFISHYIYEDYVVMFILAALLTVGLNVRTIAKYSNDFLLGILLYVFIGAWHGSFNGMRQYLAAAVLFAGHRYIYERDLKKYCLVVFVAMLFHRTALVFFPVYWVVVPRHETRNLFLIILGSIVMYYSYGLFFEIMSELKGHDQTQYAYMQQAVKVLRVAAACAPVILFIVVSPLSFKDSENSFYFKMLIINAAFMIATSSSAYLARIGVYSDIYATIAFPKLINSSPKETRKLLTIGILVCYFIFWFYEVYSRDTLHYFHWIFERNNYVPTVFY